MSNDDVKGGDDKIIDITKYVESKKSEEEVEIDNFADNFVAMFNQSMIDRQRKIARENYINFMINFLMLTQILMVVILCFIIMKLYS
jgi:hypothetical protein